MEQEKLNKEERIAECEEIMKDFKNLSENDKNKVKGFVSALALVSSESRTA